MTIVRPRVPRSNSRCDCSAGCRTGANLSVSLHHHDRARSPQVAQRMHLRELLPSGESIACATVIIENVTGADGTVGAGRAARTSPFYRFRNLCAARRIEEPQPDPLARLCLRPTRRVAVVAPAGGS